MEFIIYIVKCYMMAIAAILALDDRDACKAIKAILNSNRGKVKTRNDVLEAILETKGHHNKKIMSVRYMPIFVLSFFIVGFEIVVQLEWISIIISSIAISITIYYRHICNRAYDELRRNIKSESTNG